MTINHFTIGGDACTRADEQQIACLSAETETVFGHVTLMDALGGIGHEFGEFIERTRCLTHRTHFQPVTEQHDVDERDQFPEEAFPKLMNCAATL